jgi:glycosyltransferase involved in cell wall biosynthesis
MRILHVTPAFYPAHGYGGPIQTVYQLCRYLARAGGDVRVLTTNADGLGRVLDVDVSRETLVDGLRVCYSRRLARHAVSPALVRRLRSHVSWADVVHLTAVYSFPTMPTLAACRLLGRPVVWSPRGALQRWAGSRRVRIKRGWEALCGVIAPPRLVMHCTSAEEAAESVKAFPRHPTAVIANGVEIPETTEHRNGSGRFRVLYLGRFDPKKGIENLLLGWRRLVDTSRDRTCVLTLAGGGDPRYLHAIRERIGALGLNGGVVLAGEVSGRQKEELFWNTDVLVMPSYTENFGVVIAEALAHAVPVVASKGTPWRRIEEVGCGLWVDNAPESLEGAISAARRMPLREMGSRGREWMRSEFSWAGRARQMLDCYAGVRGMSGTATGRVGGAG